jgi:hypothetical protein
VSSLITRTRQVRTSLYNPATVAQLAIAVLAVGTFWFAHSILSLPARAEVTVANDTDYALDVAVRAPGDQSVTTFGRVERGGERTQSRLLDPGDRWVFTFAHDGVEVGELELTRDEIAAMHGTVEVPPEVGRRARSLGLQPSPDAPAP